MNKKYKYQVNYLDKENDFKCKAKYFPNLDCVILFLKENQIMHYCIIDMEQLIEVEL